MPADADEVYRYWNVAEHARSPTPSPSAINGLAADGSWIVSSAGPDRVDQYPTSGDNQYETLLYDSTNGSASRGDIVRSAREGQR